MNRGNIPGYYYDEEKKKYFKIQANHVAPTDAKYNKSNAKRQERETKKRRIEEKHEQRIRKQTIPVAKLLKHPLLGGTGLRREHGDRSLASYRIQHDAAFVDGLERREATLRMGGLGFDQTSLNDVQYMRETDHSLMSASYGPTSHCVFVNDVFWSDPLRGDQELKGPQRLHAFHDSIIAMDYTRNIVMACTGQYSHTGGNTFVGTLDEEMSLALGYQFNVGGSIDTLWDCKLEKTNLKLAFASSCGIEVHSLAEYGPVSLSNLAPQGKIETFAVDWLDTNTIAFGARREKIITKTPRRKVEVQHEVHLCDLRSKGIASRLKRLDRITGIQTPNNSGTNLVVSSSRQISLYDLRILRQDRALLSIDHTSGTTRLHTPTYGNLLAATDQDNKLQVYSLRTGRRFRTFAAPAVRGLLQRPRWEEDWRGSPYLQACAGNTVQRWKWDHGET